MLKRYAVIWNLTAVILFIGSYHQAVRQSKTTHISFVKCYEDVIFSPKPSAKLEYPKQNQKIWICTMKFAASIITLRALSAVEAHNVREQEHLGAKETRTRTKVGRAKEHHSNLVRITTTRRPEMTRNRHYI